MSVLIPNDYDTTIKRNKWIHFDKPCSHFFWEWVFWISFKFSPMTTTTAHPIRHLIILHRIHSIKQNSSILHHVYHQQSHFIPIFQQFPADSLSDLLSVYSVEDSVAGELDDYYAVAIISCQLLPFYCHSEKNNEAYFRHGCNFRWFFCYWCLCSKFQTFWTLCWQRNGKKSSQLSMLVNNTLKHLNVIFYSFRCQDASVAKDLEGKYLEDSGNEWWFV